MDGLCPSSGIKPPAACSPGTVHLPACGKTRAVSDFFVTGVDEVCVHGNDGAAIIAAQLLHLSVLYRTLFLVELGLGHAQQLIEALVLPMALIPGRIVFIGEAVHDVRGRTCPPLHHAEGLFQPDVGVITVIRLTFYIDGDASRLCMLLVQYTQINRTGKNAVGGMQVDTQFIQPRFF